MENQHVALLLALAVGLTAVPSTVNSAVSKDCGCTAQGTATYKGTFTFTWQNPPPIPTSHWSPVIGATHTSCFSMWASGDLASPGIEKVAETGNASLLKTEFQQAGSAVLDVVEAVGVPTPNGNTTDASFTADRFHPFVSATSMLAPSPDWFSGVNSVSLCKNSEWLNEVTVEVFAYDAGTDGGLSYTAADDDTMPRELIARLSNSSTRTTQFRSSYQNQALGTFRFQRVSVDTTTAPTYSGTCCAAAPTTSTTTAATFCGCSARGVASYEATFNFVWSSPAPPSANPHWSPPTGASHAQCFSMWSRDQLATRGVQMMAETGKPTTLLSEFADVDTASAGWQIGSTFKGEPVPTASGSTAANFTADRYHSVVSAGSMMAPSPDWFVGVNSLNLCNGNEWRDDFTVDVFTYDAGTDNGLNYTSADNETAPHQPIARLESGTSRSDIFRVSSYLNTPLGTFRFRRTAIDLTAEGKVATCAKCLLPSGTGRTSIDLLMFSLVVLLGRMLVC